MRRLLGFCGGDRATFKYEGSGFNEECNDDEEYNPEYVCENDGKIIESPPRWRAWW